MKKFLKTTLLATLIGTSFIGANAMAADYSKNPFTLAYDGAITENAQGKVNIHPVTYINNDGIKISANVYTPANFDLNKKYPAITVAHPNGGVKEQVAGLYAQKLAEQGYITIAADAAYQGASGGKPRQTDKPANRINDIHAMVDFLEKYQGVDTNRIGALGICGGGGYTFAAAQSDKRLHAVATVSLFNTGDVRRNGLGNSQVSTIQERLAQAAAARTEEAKGKVEYAANADMSKITEADIAKMPAGLYKDGFEYYGITHRHPNSTPRYTMGSLLDLMTWDATDHAELINTPLLIVAGDKADTLYMSEKAFEKAGSRDKELVKIPGASHIETYWKPEYVKQISEKLTDFFGKKL
ncbi:alpha/beta hydrolase [Aggregatibacter actinomycetemcomitans]|uniref:alpha/beta hydrolase n=1 Tax=Aggregatibacter actinomycetemcomitans TaxID=714 RepID=UPI00197C1762|nr:alpha/beta hydrolase [Aggregatibacter actinomycetemcomitans]MBN6078136.1 alpha/beta hydrolase [Aggregatibacter actinomycetemcomitans]